MFLAQIIVNKFYDGERIRIKEKLKGPVVSTFGVRSRKISNVRKDWMGD
jgi:hypothetical protein